jgi:Tol biopolymer transport system component
MTTRRLRGLLLAAATLAAVFVLVPAGGASSQAVTNGRIAFTSARPPGDFSAPDIYTTDPDGSNTAGPLTSLFTDSQPAYSPDGTRIAWSTFEFAGDPCCQSIAVMNADGTGRTKVINGADTKSGINNTPAWSPDGQRLAFISNFDGAAPQIGTVDVDGGGPTQITSGSFASVDPDWSPDGTKIVFDRTTASGTHLYTMNTDGTDVTQLTFTSETELEPAWSPDGTKIAYMSTSPSGYQIFVINANGSNPVQLTTEGAEEPDWSPDGTKIVFTTQRDHDYEIYTMNADGTAQTRITNSPDLDVQPTWGRATDGGGGTDDTAPAVAIELDAPNGGTPDGQSGWFVSGPVTGSVTADDTATGDSAISALSCGSLSLTESGIGTPTAAGTFSIALDGVTHIACTASDSAENTSAPVTMDVRLDTHEPDVSLNPAADACSSPVVDGWCPGTQTAGFAARDATSGTALPCVAAGGSACSFTRSSSTQGPAVMIASGAVCDVAGNCDSGIAAGPFKIGIPDSRAASLHLEVIARGKDFRLPPAAASFLVASSADNVPIRVDTEDLTGPTGQRCPGVGPLCTGEVTLLVGASRADVVIETSFGPAGRLPVYSGDCDGRGNSAIGTRGVITLAAGQMATCRITFVGPDAMAGPSPDSALVVTKTFEPEPDRVRGHPDGQLSLFGNSPLALATTSLSFLRDTSGAGLCPLHTVQPVCEWAVTLSGDSWNQIQPRLVESGDHDWLGLFSGDCNPRGQVTADPTPDGDLFECTIQNIHLEARSDPHPSSVLRVNVDAPADNSRPPKNAQIVVTSASGRQFTSLPVAPGMRHADGTSCTGLGAAICTGDVGVLVNTSPTGTTADFIIRVSSAPRGYTATFSDGCSRSPNGVSSTLIQLGVGELRSCHISFQPPTPHGLP